MANPLLKDSVFQKAVNTSERMTVSGTINKSMILWFILGCGAVYAWTHPHIIMPLLMPILIGGFILAIISIFKKTLSPVLSPVYALCEGLLLGAISLYFERMYPGIVINAILLTVAVLFCMLAAYKSGLLRATPMFKKAVFIATFAVMIVYIIDFCMNAFAGVNFPYIHSSSWLGILVSVVIVGIASFNLIIDFDLIEHGARQGAPKYMEWYGAFALMITLVWLYLEILRLLAKTRN